MWAETMYYEATQQATKSSLRRISRCYKSWVGDDDQETVNKLITFLLKMDAETPIIDKNTKNILKGFQLNKN